MEVIRLDSMKPKIYFLKDKNTSHKYDKLFYFIDLFFQVFKVTSNGWQDFIMKHALGYPLLLLFS